MTTSVSARVIDLSVGDTAAAAPSRVVWKIVAWLAGWSLVVVAMATLVATQKAIPLRYTLPSEALNYYTLAAVSLVVWFVSARMAAARWSWQAQAAGHV